MLAGISLNHFVLFQDFRLGLSRDELLQADSSRNLDELACLRPLTALIGKNASGKSSLFQAFAFLSDSLFHDIPFAAAARGGYSNLLTEGNRDSMRFELLFHDPLQELWLNYTLEISADSHFRPFVKTETAERIIRTENGFKRDTLLEISAGRGYVFSDLAGKAEVNLSERKVSALSLYGKMLHYRELCWLYQQITRFYVAELKNQPPDRAAASRESGGHKHLDATCSNVEQVLQYLKKEHPKRYKRFVKRLQGRIPNLKRTGDSFLDARMTSGNLKLFTLFLLLEDPRPLICLDEPDSGLYRDMVDVLTLELRDYSLRNPHRQIIFSTHNPAMLEALSPDEIWSFDRINGAGGDPLISTRLMSDDPMVLAMYREGIGMGSLWYGGHLEPREESELRLKEPPHDH